MIRGPLNWRVPAAQRDRRWLLAAFLLALAVRLLPLPEATRGGLRLISPDCYGHLRRSTEVAHHFPAVPVFDTFLNHPDGGVWIWPPFFDLLIGGTARLLFGKDVPQERVAWVAASLPPLLGALQLLPLYALAARVLSRRRARLAVMAYAVLPAAALWSCFGHADHHVAEALLLLLFLATAARAADARLTERQRTTSSVLAGAVLAAALLTWQGAVFVAAVGFFWALLMLGARGALMAGVATALSALGTWLFLGGVRVPFSFIGFSPFQPLLLAAGTVPVALAGVLRRGTADAGEALLAPGRRRLGGGDLRGVVRRRNIVIAALCLAAVLPRAADLAGATLRGSGYFVVKAPTGQDDFDAERHGYLSYPPEFLNSVFEAYPLLRRPYTATLWESVQGLSIGFLAMPWALFVWTRTGRRRRGQRTLLALFGLTVLAMALLQRRAVYYLAIFTALALAELLARLRLPRGACGPLLAVAVVLATGLPMLRSMALYRDAPGHDVLDLLRRLKQLDPPPPGAAGVMAPWAAGHFVTALAGRPAAADPLVYGWRRQCRLFTATDDAEAERLLKETRCRYLLTTDLTPVLPAYAAAAGRAPAAPREMFVSRVHFAASPHPLPFLTLVLTGRTGARLPDGQVVPRFKVFRVHGVEDRP